jgi:ribonuclease HI
MYFTGSKRVQGAGAGVVLISPQGDKLKYVLRMSFPQASNNEAEYEALLHGMKMAEACGATRLKIFGDSNLVVQQVMNRCDAISDNMTAYRNLYYYLDGTFDGCEVLHVSRASNEESDNLANIGSQYLPIPQGVFWEEIIERSIKNHKTSTTEEQAQHQATGSGDWQAWPKKHSRTRRSYDDRRNLDAAILGIYDKQDTTRRYSRSKKDNTMIQGFRRITRETIQEKYNGRPATMPHSSRRTKNIKRHPRRSMRTSR